MHQRLADSTFRIECGNITGSGFSFRRLDIIVTNYHVIEQHLSLNKPVFALTEDGQRISLRLLTHSIENQYDFAIFRTGSALPPNRYFLIPKIISQVERGTKIIFSGFPHGIHDLLVNEATISGPFQQIGFYIDGSVNGGNSGGPILDKGSGEIIGIVTQRRFLGAIELNNLSQQVSVIIQHFNNMAGQGSVIIVGVDFGTFANMTAKGFMVVDQILKANANSGIGIGFNINYVNQVFDTLWVP